MGVYICRIYISIGEFWYLCDQPRSFVKYCVVLCTIVYSSVHMFEFHFPHGVPNELGCTIWCTDCTYSVQFCTFCVVLCTIVCSSVQYAVQCIPDGVPNE